MTGLDVLAVATIIVASDQYVQDVENNMQVNITGVGCKPEVVEYLDKIATPNGIIPEYWSKDMDIDEMFSIVDEIDTLGMYSMVVKSFNLRAGTRIPAIHLYHKGE